MSKKNIPDKFSSLEDMHQAGYYFSSEIPKPHIKQTWVELAKSEGYSIPMLAQIAGLRRQSLYAAITNNTQLSLESAIRISLVLGAAIEELFEVDQSTLFKPCISGGGTVYINHDTLVIISESQRKKLQGTDNYHKWEMLYERLL